MLFVVLLPTENKVSCILYLVSCFLPKTSDESDEESSEDSSPLDLQEMAKHKYCRGNV